MSRLAGGEQDPDGDRVRSWLTGAKIPSTIVDERSPLEFCIHNWADGDESSWKSPVRAVVERLPGSDIFDMKIEKKVKSKPLYRITYDEFREVLTIKAFEPKISVGYNTITGQLESFSVSVLGMMEQHLSLHAGDKGEQLDKCRETVDYYTEVVSKDVFFLFENYSDELGDCGWELCQDIDGSKRLVVAEGTLAAVNYGGRDFMAWQWYQNDFAMWLRCSLNEKEAGLFVYDSPATSGLICSFANNINLSEFFTLAIEDPMKLSSKEFIAPFLKQVSGTFKL